MGGKITGGRTGWHPKGGQPTGGRPGGGNGFGGIVVIFSALICGGILFVISPLYQIWTRSSGRNQRAFGVFTMTLCLVAKSTTRRLSHRTSITTACIIILDTSNRLTIRICRLEAIGNNFILSAGRGSGRMMRTDMSLVRLNYLWHTESRVVIQIDLDGLRIGGHAYLEQDENAIIRITPHYRRITK